MKNSVRNIKRLGKQAGFTLIELVLVLTIIGAATIITVSAFNTSDETQQVQEEINNLNALSGAIRNMFNTQGNYSGLTNQVILKSVSFPEQMRPATGTNLIKHSWADDGVEVASHTASGTCVNNGCYQITLKDVPETACMSIVTTAYRHFIDVKVGSTAITGVATATSACSGDANDLAFVAR